MKRHLTDGVNTKDRATALWTAWLYLWCAVLLVGYWLVGVFA